MRKIFEHLLHRYTDVNKQTPQRRGHFAPMYFLPSPELESMENRDALLEATILTPGAISGQVEFPRSDGSVKVLDFDKRDQRGYPTTTIILPQKPQQ